MLRFNVLTRDLARVVPLVRRQVAGLAAAGVIAFGANLANAQDFGSPSGLSDRADIADFLERNYAETPVAAGLTADGNLFEVFVSPDGESWTMIITTPDGRSRVLAVGDAWLQIMEARGEPI